MLELFCLKDRKPSDQEILSFHEFMTAPDQTKWHFEEINKQYESPEEFINFFKNHVIINQNS